MKIKFWRFIKTGPINIVSLVPILIAVLLVVAWGIGKDMFFTNIPRIYNYIVLFIASILMGSVGLIYVYRKEMPGSTSGSTVKGGCAVISGIILLVFFWFLGIAGLVFSFFE